MVGSPERSLCPGFRAGIPCSLQSPDQHGIVSLGSGRIDHGVQQLIVAGRREPELGTDRVFFGADVTPPLPLEGEDAGVALGQAGLSYVRGLWLSGHCIPPGSSPS